jgi:hypothetical protein
VKTSYRLRIVSLFASTTIFFLSLFHPFPVFGEEPEPTGFPININPAPSPLIIISTSSLKGLTIAENVFENVLDEASTIYDVVFDETSKTITISTDGYYRIIFFVLCHPLIRPQITMNGKASLLVNGNEIASYAFNSLFHQEAPDPLYTVYVTNPIHYLNLYAGDVVSLQAGSDCGLKLDADYGESLHRAVYLHLTKMMNPIFTE